MNKATSKKLKITIDAKKRRPINRFQSAKLSNQLGFISTECIPVPTKWRDMEDDNVNLAMDHLEVSENISLYLQLTSFRNPEVPIVLLEEVGIPLVCRLWIPY